MEGGREERGREEGEKEGVKGMREWWRIGREEGRGAGGRGEGEGDGRFID